MLWRKQQFYKLVKVFLREERVSLMKRDQDGQQQTELKETLQKFVQFCAKIVSWLRSIAEQVNIDRKTVRKIITEDLDMRMCAKMVPKKPTEEQKQRRVTICQDLLEKQDDILGRVITGDETWIYQYDPETKRQSAQWNTANSPRKRKFRQSKWRVIIMLLTFFDFRRIVHYEFVPTGQTVTKFSIWKY